MSANTVRCKSCGYEFPSPIQGTGTIKFSGGSAIKISCQKCGTPVDVLRDHA